MSSLFTGIPRISRHITTRFIGDEAFLMNLNNLNTYSLNETAAHIWSLINGSRTFDDIVCLLMEHYDIPREECVCEISELLKSFVSEKLVVFTEDNA